MRRESHSGWLDMDLVGKGSRFVTRAVSVEGGSVVELPTDRRSNALLLRAASGANAFAVRRESRYDTDVESCESGVRD